MEGRKVRFHLAGIRNQNFILRDERTGSWWQQVTGEAIAGPWKGRRLRQIAHDEITFARFRRESPRGRVLRPDPRHAADYEPADWEDGIAKLPLVTRADPDDPLPPREVVLGIEVDGVARAFPRSAIAAEGILQDAIGEVPIVLVFAQDGVSVRAFDRRVDGRVLELARRAQDDALLLDAETASTWDFTGRAVGGPLAGKRLGRIEVLWDYWFDWKTYHPDTTVYAVP